MLPPDTPLHIEHTTQGNPTAAGGNGDFDLNWIGRSTGRAERRQIVVLAIGFAPVAAADPEEIVELLAHRKSLVSRVVDMQKAKERPVVIAADKSVKYDDVVGLLSALHAQGVKRVGLVAKEGG